MLKLKYPELEKPIFCAKEMTFMERWRDIRFHKRLWKTDERMLFLQAKLDGRAEGIAEGRAEGKAEGKAEGHTEGIAEGKAEGIAEGRAEGQRENTLQIARNALAKGSTPEFVHEITGLSLYEIEKLQ